MADTKKESSKPAAQKDDATKTSALTKTNESIEKKDSKEVIGKPTKDTSQKEISFEEAIKSQMEKVKVEVPSIEEMFEAGLQFGHETKRWHPLMEEFIYLSREGIHIVDLYKTREELEKAAKFLKATAMKGKILIVGTKRQASKIVREEAIRSGSYFIDKRWVGGLLSNYQMTSKSFKKLIGMEKAFEEGIEGRTKYEVSQMKKEWARLDRLYSGVKTIEGKPAAIIVIDAKYEKGAVREAQTLGIPIVAIVDTNTNPQGVDYVVPSNDDAISSIRLILKTLADAINSGNNGAGVKHHLKDYASFEVEIRKGEESIESEKGSEVATGEINNTSGSTKRIKRVAKQPAKRVTKSNKTKSKGILEKVQKEKEENKKESK